MTHLFINPNNEYPRHPGDILIAHPEYDGVNLPEGWKPVTPVPAPVTTGIEVPIEQFPELIDGQYFQSWTVRTLTDEELAEIQRLQEEELARRTRRVTE